MAEFIGELLARLFLLFPGAFIRWFLEGFRKPYKFYLEDSQPSIGAGAIFLLLAFSLSIFIYHFISDNT